MKRAPRRRRFRFPSIALAFLLAASVAPAQSPLTENTRKLDDPTKPGRATLADVAWLTGRWIGEGLGGTVEETWSPPLGGAMVATFRLVKDGAPAFYEMCWIREREGTLEYAVKHFDPDLRGWEEKADHVKFPLVEVADGEVRFRGLTLRRDGDRCTHYVAMGQTDGTHREIALVYRRAESEPAPGAERDGSLRALAPLLGQWSAKGRPERIIHDYGWTVGGHALRIREGHPAGRPDDAELDGTIYWNPELGKIEFVAVAGKGEGEGRLFRGEYRLLADGRIERVYDVLYRTPADVPGEELGGLARRFREVYRITGGELIATVDWWRDGRWQAYGPGKYSLVRAE